MKIEMPGAGYEPATSRFHSTNPFSEFSYEPSAMTRLSHPGVILHDSRLIYAHLNRAREKKFKKLWIIPFLIIILP
jgi:hypothetical protein